MQDPSTDSMLPKMQVVEEEELYQRNLQDLGIEF